ncbi:hypothetical protein GIB67_008969 [Kingdonia uniflora]|uniref:VAL1-3 N-terminal zinc finger domain-containing protein n=1 Tax=Kingdonia uniflora TaxID=39325 RepID=A0A7J7LVK1_9MAGN|nr:hypothetical protein GIB67_008969 [Kingdonia uniflora]
MKILISSSMGPTISRLGNASWDRFTVIMFNVCDGKGIYGDAICGGERGITLVTVGNFVYETGRFCESFYVDDDGWRSCASCGKFFTFGAIYVELSNVAILLQRLHSGCIVSTHVIVLLDAGGIDCMACARTNIPYMSKCFLIHQWPKI